MITWSKAIGSALFDRSAFVLIGLLLIGPASCASPQSSTITPGPAPIRTVTPGDGPVPIDNPGPTSSGGPDNPGPTSSAPPDATPARPTETRPSPTPGTPPTPLTLEVVSPPDGSGLEVGFTRIMGTTSGTLVSINGLPTEVSGNGAFQRDLSLSEGVNFLEVVASDDLGRTTSQQVTVFVVRPVANLPFTILYPRDGLETSDPTLALVGVTRPDAVVGVNDVPVEIGASGIFSTTVQLEEGANLIEVVAADTEGNVRFQTVAVFYIP